MLADADRVVELRQPTLQVCRGLGFQGLKGAQPLFGLRVIPLAQLRAELQQPCEPVRSFKRNLVVAFQEGDFAGNVLWCQTARHLGPRPRGEFGSRVKACQAYQQPMAVYVRMPVEAAVERGREDMRRKRVRVAFHDVGGFIRVLAVETAKREGGESGGRGGVERL